MVSNNESTRLAAQEMKQNHDSSAEHEEHTSSSIKRIDVNKIKFLEFLEFSDGWAKMNLYPDELFGIQLDDVLRVLGEEEFNKRFASGKYGTGSEHYRTGAAWWIVKVLGRQYYEQLVTALKQDPDIIMSTYLIRDIEKFMNSTFVENERA